MLSQIVNLLYARHKTLWHGTSMSRAESIQIEGFRSDRTISGGLFFSTDRNVATQYAWTRAQSEKDHPVLIKCAINLKQYNKYHRGPLYVFEFRHKHIGSEVIIQVLELNENPANQVRALPRMTLNFNSGCAAIAFWLSNAMKLNLRQDHEAVIAIKQWLIIQANAGRTGSVPEDELLELAREYRR